MNKTRLASACILALLPTLAHAELPLAKYRQLTQNPAVKKKLRNYVTGVGRGLFWSDILLRRQQKAPLFCMPASFSLDDSVIQSLLDDEIRAPSAGTHYQDDTPIELILASAFMHRFPCGSQR